MELSEGSVYQRIRRKLQGTGRRSLRIAREGQRPKLGKYFLVVGKQVTPKVDLEGLARELGAMEPWETVGEGMTDPKQSAPGRQVARVPDHASHTRTRWTKHGRGPLVSLRLDCPPLDTFSKFN